MENVLAAVAWKSAPLTLCMSLCSLSHQQDFFLCVCFFVSLLLLEGPVSLLGQLGLSEAISMLSLIKFSVDRLQRIKAFLVGRQLFLLIHLQIECQKFYIYLTNHTFSREAFGLMDVGVKISEPWLVGESVDFLPSVRVSN